MSNAHVVKAADSSRLFDKLFSSRQGNTQLFRCTKKITIGRLGSATTHTETSLALHDDNGGNGDVFLVEKRFCRR